MRRVLAWTVVALASLGAGASTVGAAAPPDPNLVAARAAAQRILSLTPLPPGAVAQSADPSVGGSLSQVYQPRGAGQVIRTQYWTVSEALGDVNAFIFRHPPAGSSFVQGAGTPSGSSTSWQQERSFPGQRGRLTSELLQINTAPAAGGGTAIRADAAVLWRPTWEQVPESARAAHVRLDGFAQGTVTGAALARLRALVNAEPVVAPGAYACPAGFPGQAIQVIFVDAQGRALVRISTDSADGCRWLSVRVGTRHGPALFGGWDLPSRLWAAGALTRCTAAQLAVSVSRPSVDPTRASATITLRNVTRTPCSLKGAPSLTLVTAAGRRLPVSDRHVRTPSSVVSAPRHGTLSAGVFWPAPSGPCTLPPPTTAWIGLPGVRPRVEVALTPSRHRLGPCTGRLSASPLGFI